MPRSTGSAGLTWVAWPHRSCSVSRAALASLSPRSASLSYLAMLALSTISLALSPGHARSLSHAHATHRLPCTLGSQPAQPRFPGLACLAPLPCFTCLPLSLLVSPQLKKHHGWHRWGWSDGGRQVDQGLAGLVGAGGRVVTCAAYGPPAPQARQASRDIACILLQIGVDICSDLSYLGGRGGCKT